VTHAENKITINRSPGEVYGFLVDGQNNTAWRSGVENIELISGRVGEVGAIYRQVLTGAGGRAIDGDYEIVTAIPGRELGFRVIAGPARPTGRYELSTVDEGTQGRFSLDLEPKGFMRLMAPMIARTMASEVDQLSQLKAVLESEHQNP
jgi:hypothetical protein